MARSVLDGFIPVSGNDWCRWCVVFPMIGLCSWLVEGSRVKAGEVARYRGAPADEALRGREATAEKVLQGPNCSIPTTR
jgi:hypothetical protein